MKIKFITSTLAAVLLSASSIFAATIADWTFETSQPGVVDLPASPGAGIWITNIAAESGSGTASGLHAASSTYSSPVGNGSSHSFSSTAWAVGDCYQFAVSTVGAQNINVSFDTVSSATGPRDFNLAYSVNGTSFTTFGSYTNGSTPSWSSSSTASQYTHTYNLSSATAINNVSVVYFRLVDASTASSNGGSVGTGGTSRVDNFIVSGATGTPPTIGNVTPSGLTTNAGNTVSFTVTNSAGDVPFTYYWYKETPTTTNLISAATVTTNATADTLTLPSVLEPDAANYQVVVSNATAINATSAPITLTVLDPGINVEPVSQVGLPHGEVQFNVGAGGTSLSYAWYYCASASDNTQITSLVGSGTQGSGSIVSGVTSSTLTITNLQASDPTNYVVVVTGTYGSVTSSVASFTESTAQVPLAFWNFNDNFNITNPAPYQGIGFALATSVDTFSQPNQDADDTTPGVNTAWGTQNYPASTSSNKLAGVQFNVSTVGAKNINVSYDVRATGTASRYHRLQYTTNAMTWIDYPTNASLITSGTAASSYTTFSYSLTGFPGAANNPNFGIRIVSEFESTALDNNTNDAMYVAVGSTASYNTAGTLSYDVVSITGDAITNNNAPPTIGTLTNMMMEDTLGNTNNFTVSDDTTPAGSLNVTATCLDPNVSFTVNTVHNAGGVCQLSLNTSLGLSTTTDNVPVLVTVTDANGDSTVAWFTLTIVPANAPPVFTGLANTNMLMNSTLTVPFTLTDDHTPSSSITPTVSATFNTTLLSNDVAHVSLGGSGSSRTLTLTPVPGQSGTVPITVSATDGGGLTTSQIIYVTVRPNTNIDLIDNFTYDTSGAVISSSDGFWVTHSGIAGELQTSPGEVTVDSVHNTEDVDAPLIGQPWMTNSGAVLYAKFSIDFTTLPDSTGAYFAHFKDNTSSGFLCRVWAVSNSPTSYKIGIGNSSGSTATTAQLPQILGINTNYVVVSRLVLSNGVSSVWVNPASESDTSATANDSLNNNVVSNLVNIYAYAFRESTASGGIVNVSNLVVGTSFNSVVGITPPALLNIRLINNQGVLTWSDSTFNLQTTTNLLSPWITIVGATSPYTNIFNSATNAAYFRLVH